MSRNAKTSFLRYIGYLSFIKDRTSINSLYNEIKWDSHQKRRKDYKRSLFFKMKNNLTPSYLSSLVPQAVGQTTRYSLRNSNNLQSIHERTALYYNFFLPSTVRDSNNLTPKARQIDSVNTFKHFLNRGQERVLKYFYNGNRRGQILPTRLRTNRSGLNNDLFLKYIVESPLCQCDELKMHISFSSNIPFILISVHHCLIACHYITTYH